MKKVTAKGLRDLIIQIEKMPNPLTIMVWGPPGIGKSYTVENVAKELGLKFVPWSLGRKEKYDVVGIPGKQTIGDIAFTTWTIPIEWKLVLDAKGEAIVLFDEFTVADQTVQNAVLDIVLQKRVDIYELPKRTLFILAGNKGGDDGTFATSITTALSGGRGIICEMIPPSVSEWIEYEESQGKLNKYIKDFLNNEPGHLYVGPRIEEPEQPWTCPRSWSQLNRVINELNIEDSETMLNFAKGLLSAPTYIKLKDFISGHDISSVKLVELDEKEWDRVKKCKVPIRTQIMRELCTELYRQYPKPNFILIQQITDIIVSYETDENKLIYFQELSGLNTTYLQCLEKIKVKGKSLGYFFDKLKKRS